MASASEKNELKNRRSIYGPLGWSLRPSAPGTEATFRRWNVVVIAILALLVLGMFMAAKAPVPNGQASDEARVSRKAGRAPGAPPHGTLNPRAHNHKITNHT